jgi:large subunit ribosomal protein L13
MELNIDGTGAIAGRISARAAKEALMGKTVNILNAEKIVISGSPEKIIEKYHTLIAEMGQPRKGPFIPRVPDKFMKRFIRGMLPYKQGRGKDAYKRIKFYIGTPEEFKDKKTEKAGKKLEELPTLKYITIQRLCKALGGKA